MSIELALFGVAVLLLLGALLLWSGANTRRRERVTAEFVERQLGRIETLPRDSFIEGEVPRGRRRSTVPGIANLLLRAGVASEHRFLILLTIGWVGSTTAALWFGGVLSAVLTFLLYGAIAWCRLWWLAARRTQKVVHQLPGFIDALVRLVTIGSSLPSAFQEVVPQMDPPLRDLLGGAVQLTQAGVELDVALRQVARVYRIEELFLIASVVGVSTRFGGRVDQVLERMAGFMRDVHQARQELVALSAETRLSAWILGLLPVGVAGFIVIFNNSMFVGMWLDPIGQKMLLGAVALQLIGSFWLYRLAKTI